MEILTMANRGQMQQRRCGKIDTDGNEQITCPSPSHKLQTKKNQLQLAGWKTFGTISIVAMVLRSALYLLNVMSQSDTLSSDTLSFVHPNTMNASMMVDKLGDQSNVSSSGHKDMECKCVDCAEDDICGGLWKGISYSGQTNNDDLSQMRVHLVVSHCKTDLHWISNFTGGYVNIASMHVITKCGHNVTGIPEMATVEELPNHGRCDHSYAKYIVSVLDEKISEEEDDDDDNSLVMFLKDDMSNENLHQSADWNDFESMVRIASSSNRFSCGQVHRKERLFDLSAYTVTEKIFQYTSQDYRRSKGKYHGDGVRFKSDFDNAGDFYHTALINVPPPPKIVQVCYGGVFATTVSSINKIDASVWSNAEMALRRGDSIEEGHFMERCWAHLLATPLEPYQINALLQYAEHDREQFDKVYHASIRGVLYHNTRRGYHQPLNRGGFRLALAFGVFVLAAFWAAMRAERRRPDSLWHKR